MTRAHVLRGELSYVAGEARGLTTASGSPATSTNARPRVSARVSSSVSVAALEAPRMTRGPWSSASRAMACSPSSICSPAAIRATCPGDASPTSIAPRTLSSVPTVRSIERPSPQPSASNASRTAFFAMARSTLRAAPTFVVHAISAGEHRPRARSHG